MSYKIVLPDLSGIDNNLPLLDPIKKTSLDTLHELYLYNAVQTGKERSDKNAINEELKKGNLDKHPKITVNTAKEGKDLQPTAKAKAVKTVMDNQTVLRFTTVEELDRFESDVYATAITRPCLVYNESDKLIIAQKITIGKLNPQSIDGNWESENFATAWSYYPFLDLTGVPCQAVLDSVVEYGSYKIDLSGNGYFEVAYDESVFTLYGHDYSSYRFTLTGDCAECFISDYREYKRKNSKWQKMTPEERVAYIQASKASKADSTAVESNPGKVSVSKILQDNKTWDSIDDLAKTYSDMYNRLGSPVLDCNGNQVYKEDSDGNKIPQYYDKNDPEFVRHLYGLAYAQARSCLSYCLDPQKSQGAKYAEINGMLYADGVGESPVVKQLINDCINDARLLSKIDWAGLNATSYFTEDGYPIYSKDGKPKTRVVNPQAVKAGNECVGKDLGDGWDVVQNAVMTVWQQSLEYGGKAWIEGEEAWNRAGVDSNFARLTPEQAAPVIDKYGDRGLSECFMNQFYATTSQKTQVVDSLTQEVKEKTEAINPMKAVFRSARKAVSDNNKQQAIDHNTSYIEAYIFAGDKDLPPLDAVLYKLGKYTDLGGFSTDSSCFKTFEHDNGKNLYTINAEEFSDITKDVLLMNLTTVQKEYLKKRFEGKGYKAIANETGTTQDSVRDVFKAIQKKYLKNFGAPENLLDYTVGPEEELSSKYFINGVKGKKRKNNKGKSPEQIEREKVEAQKKAWAEEEKRKEEERKKVNNDVCKGLEPKIGGVNVPIRKPLRRVNPITGKEEVVTRTDPITGKDHEVFEDSAPESRVVPGNEWVASVINYSNDGTEIITFKGNNDNKELKDLLKINAILAQ